MGCERVVQPFLNNGFPIAAGDGHDRKFEALPVVRCELLQGVERIADL